MWDAPQTPALQTLQVVCRFYVLIRWLKKTEKNRESRRKRFLGWTATAKLARKSAGKRREEKIEIWSAKNRACLQENYACVGCGSRVGSAPK